MLADMHETQLADTRRDAIRALQTQHAAPARAATPAAVAAQPYNPWQAAQANPSIPATPAEAPAIASTPATPVAPAAPVAPILPGSDAWRQAPAAPTPVRPSPGGGWGKSRGPHRLR
jgi:hypothetical protein